MSTTDPTTPEPQSAPVPPIPGADATLGGPPPAPRFAPPSPTAPDSEPIDAEVIEAEVIEDEPAAAPSFPGAPDVPAAAPPPPPAQPMVPPVPPTATYTTPEPTGPPQVLYMQPPAPPKKAGNRGLGTVWALLSTVVYAGLLLASPWIVGWISGGGTDLSYLTDAKFWIPVVIFALAFILLVLLANRANWWAYILGSLFVAAAVYFGTIGAAILGDTLVGISPATTFASGAVSPFVIVAALLAREVSMWGGSIIARRGRKLKVRNAEARESFEREAAERRASATG